eukprot:SAG31_NODE_44364_length_263_cov_0.628049_1_plen_43_part_01
MIHFGAYAVALPQAVVPAAVSSTLRLQESEIGTQQSDQWHRKV